MPDPKPTDAKPAGNVSPALSGEQPAPSPEVPGTPSPEAPKSGDTPSPAHKETVVPLPALQEERGKRQALEQEVAQLRQMVQNQYQQPQIPNPQIDQMQKQLDELWDEDPRKAVGYEIMRAMEYRDRVDANLEYQADQLARKYPDFNAYRSTALGQVRSLPLNQRGTANILESAYFMVRGQNADQLIQQREQELLEKYRRGELSAQGLATPPGSYSTPVPEKGMTLTAEQLTVADAMGLTPEQYMSAIKAGK